MINIEKEIQNIANKNLRYLQHFGHAKAGCNGPYFNRDTPVRNSSHWITTYAYLWKTTNLSEYKEAVQILGNYLLMPENYGQSGSIRARNDERFDKTNGLIGQAWVIEGLTKAAEILNEKKYLICAKKIFLTQPFNNSKKLWDVLDCNGITCFDQTFNHQLWFAACGSMLIEQEYDERIDKMIKDFLKGANEFNFKTHEDGLIVHRTGYKLSEDEQKYSDKLNRKRKINNFSKHPITVIQKKAVDILFNRDYSKGLEEGYHLFDLYGFALLEHRYGTMPIFQSDKLKKAVDYALDFKNIEKLSLPCGKYNFNNFAYGYNSPAFEYPYISKIFTGEINSDHCKKLLEFQFEQTYNEECQSFNKNCCDPETMDARIYELTRIFET